MASALVEELRVGVPLEVVVEQKSGDQEEADRGELQGGGDGVVERRGLGCAEGEDAGAVEGDDGEHAAEADVVGGEESAVDFAQRGSVRRRHLRFIGRLGAGLYGEACRS
jgi:hypothetical protein